MAEEKKKTNVLIIDDHPIIRHGLTQLINQEEDLVTCGEAEDGPEALTAIEELGPDIIILDITLKSTSGLDLLEPIKKRFPGIPVLMLSMHDEAIYAERSLRAGAQGYVMKQDSPEKLIEAIRCVLSRDIYLSGSMTAKMLRKIASGSTEQKPTPVDVLSARELEVFDLIGQGNATRRIAEVLSVSVKTVDAHRANIKKKLELKSGAELVQLAIKWSLARTP